MRTRLPRVPLVLRFAFAFLLSALLALLLAGCGGGGSSSAQVPAINIINGSNGLGGSTVNPAGDGTSGFTGTVSLTPTSTTSTTQAPISGAVLLAELADGTIVGQTTTDASGKYTIPLVPGNFLLIAQPISANIVPVAPAQTYRISLHSFTTVNITYIDKSKIN